MVHVRLDATFRWVPCDFFPARWSADFICINRRATWPEGDRGCERDGNQARNSLQQIEGFGALFLTFADAWAFTCGMPEMHTFFYRRNMLDSTTHLHNPPKRVLKTSRTSTVLRLLDSFNVARLKRRYAPSMSLYHNPRHHLRPALPGTGRQIDVVWMLVTHFNSLSMFVSFCERVRVHMDLLIRLFKS